MISVVFFFTDTASTEIYTLSLHDALPICPRGGAAARSRAPPVAGAAPPAGAPRARGGQNGALQRPRSEEHTSELQSQFHLVCRLLLEKKNQHGDEPVKEAGYQTRCADQSC